MRLLLSFFAVSSLTINCTTSAPTCTPSAGTQLSLQPCATQTDGQQWVVSGDATVPGTIHLAVTYVEGLCVDVAGGENRTAVTIEQCSAVQNPTGQSFTVPHVEGTSYFHILHKASGLCISMIALKIAQLIVQNRCSSKSNQLWQINSTTKEIYLAGNPAMCLSACTAGPPSPPTPPHSGPVVINGSTLGTRFDGVWAMSANGAAQQLYEYEEPLRSKLLDILFAPGQGTRWQGLKTEIGGDVESSYGSMSSFMHVPDSAQASFNRSTQFWLIKEARKRDPNIPLMALHWGMPWWVGDGVTLSEGGVQYHVAYLLGAKKYHNISFDYVGIWNEAPWTKEYILMLRKGLDDAGLMAVKIIAPDGEPSIIDDAAADPELASTVDAFGIHATLLPYEKNLVKVGKPYYNSENDLVDGVLPQWGGSKTPGLSWPRVFMLNYIVANGSAVMLCPFIHGWNQNLGRHNHGPAFFNDPWSGYFQLGAPFFTQAHFTQFTEIGWRFVEGAAGQSGLEDSLTYAALVPPDSSELTFVAVNSGNASESLHLKLAGQSLSFVTTPFQQWVSSENKYFSRQHDVSFNSSGEMLLNIPGGTVFTLSTREGAGWANFTVPTRQRFHIPQTLEWSSQVIDEPCKFISPIYGAFDIARDSLGRSACKQAVPQNPGKNAWTHRKNGWPVALTPSGTNYANVEIAVDAQIEGGYGDTFAVTVCGRVPIFAPALCMPNTFSLGVCLSILHTPNSSSASTWRLTEAHNQLNQAVGIKGCPGFRMLANGTLAGPSSDVMPWYSLQLSFSDQYVQASINGDVVAGNNGSEIITTMPAGVAAIGTAWNTALFSNFSLRPAVGHPLKDSSFLFDVLPSETVVESNFTGWAGMIIDLTVANAEPIVAYALGRFKTKDNNNVHQLGIVDTSTQKLISSTKVDMNTCTTDMLGFCYGNLTNPETLKVGGRYYVVSSEVAEIDAFVAMSKSATGADYAQYRSGDTFMSYRLPTGGPFSMASNQGPLVAGRVWQPVGSNNWTEFTDSEDIDTSFGPVNLLLLNE